MQLEKQLTCTICRHPNVDAITYAGLAIVYGWSDREYRSFTALGGAFDVSPVAVSAHVNGRCSQARRMQIQAIRALELSGQLGSWEQSIANIIERRDAADEQIRALRSRRRTIEIVDPESGDVVTQTTGIDNEEAYVLLASVKMGNECDKLIHELHSKYLDYQQKIRSQNLDDQSNASVIDARRKFLADKVARKALDTIRSRIPGIDVDTGRSGRDVQQRTMEKSRAS